VLNQTEQVENEFCSLCFSQALASERRRKSKKMFMFQVFRALKFDKRREHRMNEIVATGFVSCLSRFSFDRKKSQPSTGLKWNLENVLHVGFVMIAWTKIEDY
jgi:hypothetical protein